jgi:hypothetical protein
MKIITVNPRGGTKPIHINANYIERIVPSAEGCAIHIHDSRSYNVTEDETALLYMLRQA